MTRIVITAAAYTAIVDGRPECTILPPQEAPQGGVYLWLDKITLDRLTAERGPAESYSDAILRLANVNGEAA